MPNTREKLIELFEQEHERCLNTLCNECKYDNADDCGLDALVDHLIANGVTVTDTNVGKWISVKDRLPEPFVSVLVQMPGEKPFPTVREGFVSKDGIWHSALYDREPDEVTHWQPMPQPPKGE